MGNILMPSCSACNAAYEMRPEDQEFYKIFGVPAPRQCPDCRLRKRLLFRNERSLYYRASSLSQHKMISMYHQDSPYVVYSPKEWWSDQWDGLHYGQDVDFTRPFFDQFQQLRLNVPRIALFNVNSDNSDYCQQAYDNKNCYLCTVVTKCQDCQYVTQSNKMQDCFDCTLSQNCQLSYDCLDSDKLYACVSCQSCQNSSGLLFCYDLIGCQDCFGCWGLRNKKNHIFNKAYSAEEYKAKVESLQLGWFFSFERYKQHFKDVASKAIHRADRNIITEDSLGNYLINAKNAYLCYDSFQIQDSAYCTWVFDSNNCQDVYGLGGGQFVYQGLGVEKLNMAAFNTFVSDGGEAFYSDLCFYCTQIFGCVGLRNKKFCLFNKQYSQADYEALKGKLIEHMKATGEWGEFFPVSMSPFAYNETVANDFFPITKDQSMAAQIRWRDPDPKEYVPQAYQVPDNLKEVKNDILQAVLACGTGATTPGCGKNFKITPQELQFYRNQNIPLPRKCPDCRYRDRRALRNPRVLLERPCGKCITPIKTTYAQDRTEIIYCQKCYLETVN